MWEGDLNNKTLLDCRTWTLGKQTTKKSRQIDLNSSSCSSSVLYETFLFLPLLSLPPSFCCLHFLSLMVRLSFLPPCGMSGLTGSSHHPQSSLRTALSLSLWPSFLFNRGKHNKTKTTQQGLEFTPHIWKPSLWVRLHARSHDSSWSSIRKGN